VNRDSNPGTVVAVATMGGRALAAATPGGTEPGVARVPGYVIAMTGNFKGYGFRHPPWLRREGPGTGGAGCSAGGATLSRAGGGGGGDREDPASARVLASPAGHECRALVGYCPPLRQPQTLGPVLDAVRQAGPRVDGLRLSRLAGALQPLLPEWTGILPPPLEPLEDASAARYRVFRALADLLGCLAVAVLIVEDAQWADDASLEFLLFLTSVRPCQVSLVVTYRAEDTPTGSLLRRLSSRPAVGTAARRIVLGPLDVADTARMVSSSADTPSACPSLCASSRMCTAIPELSQRRTPAPDHQPANAAKHGINGNRLHDARLVTSEWQDSQGE
jgi:hypothetical protein